MFIVAVMFSSIVTLTFVMFSIVLFVMLISSIVIFSVTFVIICAIVSVILVSEVFTSATVNPVIFPENWNKIDRANTSKIILVIPLIFCTTIFSSPYCKLSKLFYHFYLAKLQFCVELILIHLLGKLQ